MTRKSAFIIGEAALTIQCATSWLDRGNRLSGLATTVPEVAAWARGRDVPVFVPTSPDLPRALAAERPDYLFSIVYLQMLPEAIISAPLRAAINFHDGPLPRYAGLNVTSWAILAGEAEHGVSWHEMTTRADAGQIFVQQAVDIGPDATAFELNAACFAAGIESFATLCERIETGSLAGHVQDETARTYFGRLDRPADNALLPFSGGNEAVTRLVRALDYGAVPNPLAVPKLMLPDGRVITARRAEIVSSEGRGEAPGTLLTASSAGWEVATADGAVRLTDLRLGCGAPVDPAAFADTAGLTRGTRLGGAPEDEAARSRLRVLGRRAARAEERVARALSTWSPFRLPAQGREGAGAEEPATPVQIEVPAALQARASEAALLFLARLAAGAPVSVGVSSAAEREAVSGVEAFFAATAPLRLECDASDSANAAFVAASAALDDARRATPWAIDLLQRDGSWAGVPRTAGGLVFPVIIARDRCPDDGPPPPAEELVISIAPGGTSVALEGTSALDRASVDSLGRQLDAFLGALRGDRSRAFRALPLADARDLAELATWNDTARPFPDGACLHQLIAEQAARTPDAVALRCGEQSLTYAQLDRHANALAHVLRGAGSGPDRLVGLYLERSLELVVGALGVWKAGAAYVPLDPSYPRDRLAYMIEDAEIETVLAQPALAGAVPSQRPRVIPLSLASVGEAPSPPQTPVQSGDLAYVIYTSGSTGRPKGVMVEHRNVANFFVGMDERLGFEPGRDEPGVWLAVTSLSFDISVLELFWTLSRGFEVVLHRAGEAHGGEQSAAALQHADTDIDFGLFYFSSDESATGAGGKYRLLLEGARFADAHGFNSVWTPERHFHAFGGLYPNPSVTSAAVATITQRVQLRAGSCVSPLHHPVRVAEEWSVVDNLSNGRVGLAFAAGWQPNDFLLNPPRYPDRKNEMLRDIETVRRLWRGEAVTFPGPTGEPVDVRTLPRPVQAELPYWVTAAGNPETFAAAGRLGANLLTHLLGQSVAEVTEKVRIYREARREAGHEGPGVVSLMLHTFVGHSEEAVRETVREPMKQYLSSAVGLVKAAAWQFPTFKATTTMADGSFGIDHLSAEEMDALLDHAFRRYYDTSGLFGTVDQCVAIVDGLKACGIDEIACLIDFGVPTQAVIDQLPLLAEVLRRSKPVRAGDQRGALGSAAPAQPETVDALIARHRVTHLQCTPSMAQMLVVDEGVRAALGGLAKLMVGGEAFPPPLARDLERLVRGDVINMYGPTETTIWSTTHPVRAVGDDVPIGRPIANTDLLVLDALQQPVPNGALGELCIGGAGVVRGYLGRPELTAERFVRHPLRPEERIYRTGDLARFRDDGVVEFRGRLDHQVKLRGYRIELGEIEAVIGEHEAVREVAVVLREDTPGARRLVAYVITRDGAAAPAEALRAHVQARLPEYMVPSLFVGLERFPRTPNQKIDRKAFPAPEGVASAAASRDHVAPTEGLQSTIAAIWRDVLGLARVGADDNFFDLGGHSLLTIEVHRRLRESIERPVTLIDLFRFPTIRSLSSYLESNDGGAKAAEAGAERAQARRDAMNRRQSLAAARRRR